MDPSWIIPLQLFMSVAIGSVGVTFFRGAFILRRSRRRMNRAKRRETRAAALRALGPGRVSSDPRADWWGGSLRPKYLWADWRRRARMIRLNRERLRQEQWLMDMLNAGDARRAADRKTREVELRSWQSEFDRGLWKPPPAPEIGSFASLGLHAEREREIARSIRDHQREIEDYRREVDEREAYDNRTFEDDRILPVWRGALEANVRATREWKPSASNVFHIPDPAPEAETYLVTAEGERILLSEEQLDSMRREEYGKHNAREGCYCLGCREIRARIKFPSHPRPEPEADLPWLGPETL